MNVRLLLTLALALFTGAALAQEPEAAPAEDTEAAAETGEAQVLDTEIAKISYALGLQFGVNMKEQDVEVDVDAYAKGLNDGFGDGEPAMTEEEVRQTMINFQLEMQKKLSERRALEADANAAAGDTYLSENKARDGVITLESGLQYEVLKEGEGDAKPVETDIVKVDYTGRLTDGSVFDSSVERGQPATFPVNRVIPGWTEVLQLMNVGSKWRVVIPPALGYGERGAPPRIGPNAVLDFEVELIEINPEPPQGSATK